jgi:outer membrane protein TolC
MEVATARYAVGSSPQSDPLTARLTRARLSSEEAALTAEETGVRAKLMAIRGKTEPDSLAITPLDAAEVLRLYPTLEAHPHGGPEELQRHPLLGLRRAEVAAAEAMAQVQRLEARPGLELMARYGARPIASDFFTAGVGLRLPLWGSRAQREMATATQQEAEAGRIAIREQLATLTAEYWSSVADATAGLERLRLLLQDVIPTAEATREAALRSYRTGGSDFVSVLTALEAVYRVRLEASELAAHHLSHLIMLEQLTKEDGAP